MPNYSDPFWMRLVKTIAEECDVEEVSAEGAADAVLALPEIKEAMAAKVELDALKLALLQQQSPPNAQ